MRSIIRKYFTFDENDIPVWILTLGAIILLIVFIYLSCPENNMYIGNTLKYGLPKKSSIVPDNGRYGRVIVYEEPHGDGTKFIEFSGYKVTKTPIKNGDFYYASGEYFSSCDQNHYHDDIFIVCGRFIDHNHVKYSVENVYYYPGRAVTEFKKEEFDEYCVPEPIGYWRHNMPASREH